MSSLPCGITDAMCEPYDPPCGGCGHLWSDHYEEDDTVNIRNNHLRWIRNGNSHNNQIKYDAEGYVTHACDIEITKGDQCDCEKFNDEPSEPDWGDYDD